MQLDGPAIGGDGSTALLRDASVAPWPTYLSRALIVVLGGGQSMPDRRE